MFFKALKSNCFWAVSIFLHLDEALFTEINALSLKRLYNEVETTDRVLELMTSEEDVANALQGAARRALRAERLSKKKAEAEGEKEVGEKDPLLPKDAVKKLYSESMMEPSTPITPAKTPDLGDDKSDAGGRDEDDDTVIPHYESEIYMEHVKIFFEALFGLAYFPQYVADSPVRGHSFKSR